MSPAPSGTVDESLEPMLDRCSPISISGDDLCSLPSPLLSYSGKASDSAQRPSTYISGEVVDSAHGSTYISGEKAKSLTISRHHSREVADSARRPPLTYRSRHSNRSQIYPLTNSRVADDSAHGPPTYISREKAKSLGTPPGDRARGRKALACRPTYLSVEKDKSLGRPFGNDGKPPENGIIMGASRLWASTNRTPAPS
jgi:hypothetical protein